MQNIRRKTILSIVVGFISGLVFGLWVYNIKVRVNAVRKCHPVDHGPDRRPRSIAQELGRTRLLFIGFLIDTPVHVTHINILYGDWPGSIASEIVIFTLKTTDKSLSSKVNLSVVYLEGFTSNSKQEVRYLLMLRYISDHYSALFKWFMLATYDFFIDTDKLSFLRHLSDSEDLLLTPDRTCGKQKYIFTPGIIISSSFLKMISSYLENCSQNLPKKPQGDKNDCFEKTQEVNMTTSTKHCLAICNDIDDHFATKVVTTDQPRDANCMYRLQVRLLSQKLRVIDKNYVKTKSRLNILTELNRANVYERRAKVKEKDAGKEQRHAQMYNMKRMFCTGKKVSRGLRGREKEAINWAIENSMDNLSGRKLKFRTLHYGYTLIKPTREIQYILHIYTDTEQRYIVKSTQVFGHLKAHVCTIVPTSTTAVVNIVVPLAGRLETFKQFLENLDRNILSKGERVSLLIVYFPEKHPSNGHRKIFEMYKAKFSETGFNWVNLTGHFARARALQAGVRFFKDNDLIFFSDVDLIFNSEFLRRCRDRSVAKQQAYFPVMFKFFNPKIGGQSFNSTNYFRYFKRHIGYWNVFSFGPVCAYREDVASIGGFNVEIKQWGFEDVQLFERFLASKKYELLRTVDPGLVHVYHPHTQCDIISNIIQRRMCTKAMLDGLASQGTLVKYLLAKGHLKL